jgi:hypothetical protein
VARRTLIIGNKKRCPACYEWLDLSKYGNKAKGPGGKEYWCKACKASMERFYRFMNKTRKRNGKKEG